MDPTASSRRESCSGRIAGLQHHVTLCGPMTAGARNKFYAYCSIGQQTQDLKYQGEPTYLEIGDENSLSRIRYDQSQHDRRGQDADRASRKFSRLQPHWPRLRGGRRGHLFQQWNTRRTRSGRRPRGHGRADRGPSILPDRTLCDHGWLFKDRSGHSTIHDCRWKSGQGARDQSSWTGAQRISARERQVDQGSVSPDLSFEIQHSARRSKRSGKNCR